MADPKQNKNPYADKDGFPMDGKETQFFAWARDQELQRRKSLPEDERKAIEVSEQALAKRMNS